MRVAPVQQLENMRTVLELKCCELMCDSHDSGNRPKTLLSRAIKLDKCIVSV